MRSALRLRSILLLSAVLAAPAAHAEETLDSIEAAHWAAEWAASPASATLSGIHRYDAQLDDVSLAAEQAQVARLHRERDALAGLDLSAATRQRRDDRDILRAGIDGELLLDERVQPLRHNPDAYLQTATNALYGLIDRDFAPATTRMRDVIARENRIPALLALAKRQLDTVPAVFVEIAREDLKGAQSFVGDDVPAAFAGVPDAGLHAQLKASTQRTQAALNDFQGFLAGLKPSGSFVLGAETMRAMLAADLVDVPIDRLVAAGRAQLHRDQQAFQAVARQVDPAHPDRALDEVRKDHPTPADLLQTVRDQLKGAQDFVTGRHLVTLPDATLPSVIPTPAFERSLITAAMDWAGPFETHSTASFYDVTPIDTALSARQQEEALADFNRPALLNITVHEAMPGHFVQGLIRGRHPEWSTTRKASASYATTEGWAHYTEQMMIEQGFEGGDPKLHLMQLQDALLRDCRFLDAFGMHAQGMTLPQATALMQHECYQSSVAAYKEARRGTADPGYYAYTLGKLMILHLRDDMQRTQGKDFSLQSFHDRLLGAGLVPLKIIRRELTGQDAPLL